MRCWVGRHYSCTCEQQSYSMTSWSGPTVGQGEQECCEAHSNQVSGGELSWQESVYRQPQAAIARLQHL